jgi:hypothetical protein
MTQVSGGFVRRGSMYVRSLFPLAVVSLLAAVSFAQITEDSVITLNVTRAPVAGSPPVTQSFIQSPPPGGAAAATAVLITLAGRTGDIQLTPTPATTHVTLDGTLDVNSGNFLVRSRWLFASRGFEVLTLDSATDFQQLPNGLIDEQGSLAHVTDVLQVIAYARSIPGLPAGTPVWVVGTSRGTAGAWVAGGANPLPTTPNPPPIGPDGLVFTSPINISTDPDSLLSAPLANITVPTLIFNNKASTCADALASGDPAVLKALTAAPVKANGNVNNAGFTALSSNCESLSPHGYFGIEPDVVTKISNWIIAK